MSQMSVHDLYRKIEKCYTEQENKMKETARMENST